ncbi:MAG: class I SAM-dependent methyltransferase, partial [Cyclonatronaceae bacterium]
MSALNTPNPSVATPPLANKEDARFRFNCCDYSVSGQAFELWESPRGYCFTHPVPADLASYYDSSSYLSHHSDEPGLMAALYRLARRTNSRWKKRLLRQYLKKTGASNASVRLLDFGCGTGHFAGACAGEGHQVRGIETDPDAAALAREHTGLPIYSGFSALPAPQTADGFDAITAWHVLEHVPQPAETLHHFYAHLKPGGLAFIAVPNFNSFDARFYGNKWAGYDVPRHLHHFTPGFLEELAAAQGFRAI